MAKRKAVAGKKSNGGRKLREAKAEQELAETEYTTTLLKQLTAYEAQEPNFAPIGDTDERGWQDTRSGVYDKDILTRQLDPARMRQKSYQFWRFHPQGRGILRNFVRFIIGREFAIDFDDPKFGKWTDEKKSKVEVTTDPEDELLCKVLWTEFEFVNKFTTKRKEIILRVFRDGEVFIRRFGVAGRVLIRFIEPERVNSNDSIKGSVVAASDVDMDDPIMASYVGQETAVENGIEYIKTDRETVIAYHINGKEGAGGAGYERVPAKEMIHAKAFADSNDLRGICLLEVVAKTLTNYEQWEHYRMVLNKVRTAIALVRKVEGTAAQARSIIDNRAGRGSANAPQTASGRREAMFQAGTILTPSPGVSYDFMSPKLDARDAGEDGRRFLLSVAAGVGLPEMLVTGDWSNSNYSSAVESRTPAVREWEDWQDFFEPVFKTLVKWVIAEAVEHLDAPKLTLWTCTINWPILIAKDAAKETARNMNLFNGSILSRHTWSAREELNYDDELAYMQDEAEDQLMLPLHAVIPDQVRQTLADLITPAPGAAGTKLAKVGKKNPVQPNEVTGAAGAKPGPTIEAKNLILKSLRELHEEVESVEDEDVRFALSSYLHGLGRVLKNA